MRDRLLRVIDTWMSEVDFQSMRAARNALGQDFVNAYKNEVGASEPQEDFDDRNALYSMQVSLCLLPLHSGMRVTDRSKAWRLGDSGNVATMALTLATVS